MSIEQTVNKEDSPYAAIQERTRPAKSKSSRAKSRRSPYPHITHTDYSSPEYHGTERTYDYNSDVAAVPPIQGYSGVVYPHPHDGVSAYYPSSYTHTGMYTDSTMSMYPYPAHQRYMDERNIYRGHYEDKYYPNRDAAYSAYTATTTTSSADTGSRLGQIESRDAYARQTETTARVAGSNQYDCVHSGGGQCSRSSSRDANYSSATTANSQYPTSYSNPRSESSASEVDVVTDDSHYDKRQSATSSGVHIHSKDRGHGSKFDSLIEATQRLVKEENYKPSSANSQQQQQQHSPAINTHKEAMPQSVIMRRQSSSKYQTTDVRTNSTDLNYRSPSNHLKSPQQTSSTSDHKSSNGTPDDIQSNSTCSVAHTNGDVISYKNMDLRTDKCGSNSNAHNSYTSCVKNVCSYDAYNQVVSPYTNSLQGQRSYSMMPQAGYTSVIVDAQQYHMANGYVH